MRRPLTVALAAATALVLTVTACGGGDDGSGDGKTTLTMALWNYDSTPEFKALITAFEAEHPDIHIKPVDILAGEDYQKKVTAMLAGGDQTDVITMKNVTDYSRYATRGQLAPVTDLASKLDRNTQFGLEDFNLDGTYYALPYRQDFWVLYYNKKLLKADGVDLEHLTWQQYAQLAKASTQGGGADRVYGTYQHTWRSVVQAIAAAQTGGNLLGGDYGFMTDQYDMTMDLQKSGAMLAWGTAFSQKVSYNTMFSTGKAAMLPMGTWYIAALLDDKAKGKTDVDWGIAPMPQIADNGKVVTFGSPTAFAVNRKARHAAAAKTFVAWAAGERGAETIAKIGVYPSFHNAAILDVYASVAGVPTDPITKRAFQPDTIVLEMPVSEKSSDVDAILTEEHQLIMVGDTSVGAGIAEMGSRVKSEVK